MKIADILTNIALVGSAGGVLWKTYRATRMIEDMHRATQQRKKENEVILRGVLASLDGLIQIGANGQVTHAKKEIEAFLIKNRE